MGITKKITCDNCGAEKLQSNHWFMANTLPATKKIEIIPFILDVAEQFNIDILCGESCVLQYVSKNLPRILPKVAPSLSEHPAEAAINTGFFGEAEDDLEHRRR